MHLPSPKDGLKTPIAQSAWPWATYDEWADFTGRETEGSCQPTIQSVAGIDTGEREPDHGRALHRDQTRGLVMKRGSGQHPGDVRQPGRSERAAVGHFPAHSIPEGGDGSGFVLGDAADVDHETVSGRAHTAGADRTQAGGVVETIKAMVMGSSSGWGVGLAGGRTAELEGTVTIACQQG